MENNVIDRRYKEINLPSYELKQSWGTVPFVATPLKKLFVIFSM